MASTMLEAALSYAVQNLPVIPLCWPTEDGRCACGKNHELKNVGKAPMTNRGLHDATQTQQGVEEYWRKWPKANVGIVIPAGHFVIDVDPAHGGFESLGRLQEDCGELPATWTITTGSGGLHYWYRGNGVKNTVALAGYPGIDVRGIGGYVVAPPSHHREGQRYEVSAKLPIAMAPDWLMELVNKGHREAYQSGQEGQQIAEGQRNQTLTSLAGTMRRRGMPEAAIEAALAEVNRSQCNPPLPKGEIKKIAASVSRYEPVLTGNGNNVCMSIQNGQLSSEAKSEENRTCRDEPSGKNGQEESLAKRVLEWVKGTHAWWATEELDRDLGFVSASDRDYRGKILRKLRVEGIVEQHPKINKQFRYVNTKVTNLNFKTASGAGILPIRWPLGVEEFVNLFPGNMVVVAGSPNTGKTALMLNFIYLNQGILPIYYFCSEMGEVELRDRLDKFPGMDIEDWHFEAVDRASDFADVIRPDCVNLIDYLEMTTELYMINAHLTAISHKLGSGFAIVAIQKKQGAIFGRGQEFGLEKPKLYLSLDKGKLQIVKGKSWAKKNVDPNGLQVSFKIIDGCQFEACSSWDRPIQ